MDEKNNCFIDTTHESREETNRLITEMTEQLDDTTTKRICAIFDYFSKHGIPEEANRLLMFVYLQEDASSYLRLLSDIEDADYEKFLEQIHVTPHTKWQHLFEELLDQNKSNLSNATSPNIDDKKEEKKSSKRPVYSAPDEDPYLKHITKPAQERVRQIFAEENAARAAAWQAQQAQQASVRRPHKVTAKPVQHVSRPQTVPRVPVKKQATNKEASTTTRRNILIALGVVGVAAFAIDRGLYYDNLNKLKSELEQLKEELQKIGNEFKGVTYMSVVQNPGYYTGLLVKGTKTIEKVIALIDKIEEEGVCIKAAYFLEPKKEADKIINRFQSGNMQFIYRRAKNVKEAQAAAIKVKNKLQQGLAKAKRYRILGDAIKIGEGLVEDVGEKLPSVQAAKEVGNLVLALSNFMFAFDDLVSKLKKLKKSFKELECKAGEEMDPVIKTVMDNPVEGKREKAKEAIRLLGELQVNDSRGEDVEKLQTFLVEHGYLPGKGSIDGDYGGGTLAATKALSLVLNKNVEYAKQYCASADIVVVRNNNFVRRLQAMLKDLGYLEYEAKTDGDFGESTFNAYDQFFMDVRGESLCE